ncbi:MAG: rod shape-determining protein MreD [Ruminococcaceae bacterium]|nr:rod shape-determining protein MreD [Oscillospiraceae bacterium]
MKGILHTVYLLIAIILSTTLFAAMDLFGVKPNMFIIYLVIAGFYVSQKEAIWLGMIYGLFYDIIVGHCLGLNGILFMFECFFTVLFCENMIRRSNVVISAIAIVWWTILIEGINALFSPVNGILHILYVIGIEAVYNSVLMLIVYAPLNGFFRRLYDEKR